MPSKLLSPEKFARHVLLLFYPVRDVKELLSGSQPMYQNKLQEKGVQDVVNINKMKFEPYDDLVDQAFLQFNANSINNQETHSQIENDETPGAEYSNESDSEEETNKTSALPNFMPQILLDDEIAEGVSSLNSKQREVFNVAHARAKDYVNNDGYNHLSLSGIGGTSKSHLVKGVYNAISKTLLYHCKDPEKPSSFTWSYNNISSKYG